MSLQTAVSLAMNDHYMLNVVEFLGDWTNTLLLDCKRKVTDLHTFLLAHDFQSYWKYYKELIPYLKKYGDHTGDAEIIGLVGEYARDNLQGIQLAIQSRSGYCLFNCFDPVLPHSGTAELAWALRNVYINIGDLIYELNVRIILLSGVVKEVSAPITVRLD